MMAQDARKYRLHALECVKKAETAADPQERAAFLSLSERWIELAETVETEQALLAQDDKRFIELVGGPVTIH